MNVKEHIILSAQELIYQKGYLGTSISDIMAAASVGKGQLYHYFKSKKEIGLAATDTILEKWRSELFVGIFESENPGADKFTAMLDWVCQFHESQTTFYGCPIGNLIVELSTEDEEFRAKLNDFMTEWLTRLAHLLQELHPEWTGKQAKLEASQIIATVQGSIVLLKMSQNIAVLENSVVDLKRKYIDFCV